MKGKTFLGPRVLAFAGGFADCWYDLVMYSCPVMGRRRTQKDQERIIAEVHESIKNPPVIYELYVKCECGHWQYQRRGTCTEQPGVVLQCDSCRWERIAAEKSRT
jgi:hypothetical protein